MISADQSETYDQLLAQCKQHSMKLKDVVPKMYETLTKKGLSPVDAKDRILRDLVALGWNKVYVRGLFPPESKDQTLSAAAKRKAQKSVPLKPLLVSATGREIESDDNDSDDNDRGPSSSAARPLGYWCEFCSKSIPMQNDNDTILHLKWHVYQGNAGNMFSFSVGTIYEGECMYGVLHKVMLSDNRRIELQSSENVHHGGSVN